MHFGSIIHYMVIDINETRLKTAAQLGVFLEGTLKVKFQTIRNDVERYGFIAAALGRIAYRQLGKVDKGVVMCYPRGGRFIRRAGTPLYAKRAARNSQG